LPKTKPTSIERSQTKLPCISPKVKYFDTTPRQQSNLQLDLSRAHNTGSTVTVSDASKLVSPDKQNQAFQKQRNSIAQLSHNPSLSLFDANEKPSIFDSRNGIKSYKSAP